MEVYLIRHPEVKEYHKICYGNSDMQITDEALQVAAERAKKSIPDYKELTYISSDLTRCRLLAENLSGGNVTFTNALREINFGDWELKSWDEIPSDEVDYWMKDYVNNKTPGGESYIMLYNRVIRYWNELIIKDYSKVGVVIHGGVIRAILARTIEMPLKSAFKFKLDFGGVTKIVINKELETVEFINK